MQLAIESSAAPPCTPCHALKRRQPYSWPGQTLLLLGVHGQVVLVGARPELGSWQPLMGAQLQWAGDSSCWAGRISVGPGRVKFKVRVDLCCLRV